MAFYVQYTPDVHPLQDGEVMYWLFPEEFSQSRLGDRELGSNACTIIAVLTAAKLQVFRVPIWGLPEQPLSRLLVATIAEAIIEGNDIYTNLALTGQLADPNLDVMEALLPVRQKYPFFSEWPLMALLGKENIIREPLGLTLGQNLSEIIMNWLYNPPADKQSDADLFITLVANTRTTLFVYQQQVAKVALIDSHSHPTIGAGALLAQTRVNDVEGLCNWFTEMSLHCFGAGPDIMEYELSCLYMQDPDRIQFDYSSVADE